MRRRAHQSEGFDTARMLRDEALGDGAAHGQDDEHAGLEGEDRQRARLAEEALASTGGNVGEAARRLGISRAQYYRIRSKGGP